MKERNFYLLQDKKAIERLETYKPVTVQELAIVLWGADAAYSLLGRLLMAGYELEIVPAEKLSEGTITLVPPKEKWGLLNGNKEVS